MGKDKVIVQFDVDGVLADFIKGFTTLANSMFGSPIRYTLTQLDWNKYEGLDKRQINEVWRAIEKSDRFWLDLAPLVSYETFRRIGMLASYGVYVYAVTARHTVGREVPWQTQQWFNKRYLPGMPVIYTPDKAGFAAAVGVTHSIDDKLENAIRIGQFSRAKSFLLTRPYNDAPTDFAGTFTRVATVEEFLTAVEGDIDAGNVASRPTGDAGRIEWAGQTEAPSVLAA